MALAINCECVLYLHSKSHREYRPVLDATLELDHMIIGVKYE